MISPEFLRDLGRWRAFFRVERLGVPLSRAFCAGVPKKRICFADILRRPLFAIIRSRVVWAMFVPYRELVDGRIKTTWRVPPEPAADDFESTAVVELTAHATTTGPVPADE